MNDPHKRFNRIGKAICSLAEDILPENPAVAAKLALAFEEIDKAHHDYTNSIIEEAANN